jgi:malate dehydrogenase (quinone)
MHGAAPVEWGIVTSSNDTADVVLIGGGIMSATLASLLTRLEPDWDIRLVELQGELATESSNPWNNAGTGHAALCELNYTPQNADGSIEIAKAVTVNEQFQVSRQFWAHLVDEGALPEPKAFINPTPHLSFVWGEDNVAYLRARYEALVDHPLFAGMEYSDDPRVIREWTPLLLPGRRKDQPIAATRIRSGSDVDFGALTRLLLDDAAARGVEILLNRRVKGLKRKDGLWHLRTQHTVGRTPGELTARFVFVGAGGGALKLLQKSGIDEAKGFGGFPISGEFLRTDDPELVARHQAKVYGKASVGAPPMSVPHLDTRVVDGSASLLFGPYAGFSPRFLKRGALTDLPGSITIHNLVPMIKSGLGNLDLVGYLVGQLLASKRTKFAALEEFVPNADPAQWRPITAGQRVQVITKEGVIQFGTQVITGAEGSIAGLLGASPGASTAVPIMLGLLEQCFPDRIGGWTSEIERMVPSYGTRLSDDPAAAEASLARTAQALGLHV